MDQERDVTKEVDAYHEAGHAVVDLRLGLIVDVCHIKNKDPEGGKLNGVGGQCGWSRHVRPDDLSDEQNEIDGICVAVAGRAAQLERWGVERRALGS